jgi:hypothetical protein
LGGVAKIPSCQFQALAVGRDFVEPIAAADEFRFTTTDVVMSMNRKPEVGLPTDFTDFTDGLEQDWPTASLLPFHPRGETRVSLNRLPIRVIL